MDSARLERIQSLFHAAADRPADEQRAFVEGECPDDPTLAAHVMALLAEDARGASILDRGVAAVAGEMFRPADAYGLPARTFGPYRITRVLGEGGMGVVYLAERSDLGTLAAIKVLRDAWLSPARRERFASEQRTLAQLNHPLIARLYDAGTLDDGTPWFVMEYVEGVSLAAYCEGRSASLRERLRLFRDVCVAVQHAHQHLVIHRDLKPSNILVTADASVKLLDFGIAKQLDSDGPPADATRTALRMMTPAYAAPEQLSGGRIGIHTDVYALGVILYELIVGRLPFDPAGKSPGEMEALISAQSPERPSAAARRRSLTGAEWGDLDVLCLTAMHRDPQRRYATVDALIRDVDHYLNAEPLVARPDSVRYRAGKFVRRHRAAVAASTVATAVMIALVAYYTVRLQSARNAAIADAARVQRIQRFTLDLFQGGDPEAGPSDTLHVATLVDRGVREARSLDAEPAVQADLYLTLGGIYQKLGNLPRADSLIQLALERRRALLGPSHRDVGAALIALGDLRIDEARLPEAEQLIRDGLAVARRTLPSNDPGVLTAMRALGRVLQERGEYGAAIPVLQAVVRLVEQSGGPAADVAASESALADAHYYAGHYDVADSLNHRVLATYRRVYGDRHPLISDILINLGVTQFDRGHYPEAERLDREALAITRAFYGDDSYQTASNLTMVGRALIAENRLDEADSILRRALAIRERVYGPVHPAVASTVNDLGNLAMGRDRYDDAEGYYRRMLTIYHQIYGDKHYLIALATGNLATVYLRRHEYARAERLARDAVRRFTAAQGPDHVNTGVARVKLGRALLRQGKFDAALTETHAAYDVLSKLGNPAYGFLQNARVDLAAEYDSLKQPDLAARFRSEHAVQASAAKKKP